MLIGGGPANAAFMPIKPNRELPRAQRCSGSNGLKRANQKLNMEKWSVMEVTD
jgi:hypothetical protein